MSCPRKDPEIPCNANDTDEYNPGILSNTGTAWIKTLRELLMAPPLKCCDCIPPAQPCPPPEEEDEEFNACKRRLQERRGQK